MLRLLLSFETFLRHWVSYSEFLCSIKVCRDCIFWQNGGTNGGVEENGNGVHGNPTYQSELPSNARVVFNNPSFSVQDHTENGNGETQEKPISNEEKMRHRRASHSSMGSEKPSSRGSLRSSRRRGMNSGRGTSSILRNEGDKGMVLPFDPVYMAFKHIFYSVDLPAVSLFYFQHIFYLSFASLICLSSKIWELQQYDFMSTKFIQARLQI